jgi:hypothetical protein
VLASLAQRLEYELLNGDGNPENGKLWGRDAPIMPQREEELATKLVDGYTSHIKKTIDSVFAEFEPLVD